MPFTVEWEPQGVVVRNFGLVTPADGLFTSEAVSGDIRIGTIRYVLVDFRAAEGFRFAGPEEATYSTAVTIGAAAAIPGLAVAFIHPDREVRRQMKPVLDQFPFAHAWFDTEEAAREWVGRAR